MNDDDGINSKFSIDGYAHGNWTRFIKCASLVYPSSKRTPTTICIFVQPLLRTKYARVPCGVGHDPRGKQPSFFVRLRVTC